MKSYKNEISYLTQNIETLKTELKLQQEASANYNRNESKQVKFYFEDNNCQRDNNQPMYRSTAEFIKTKLVTIPSCECSPLYAVETEGIVEEKMFYNQQENFEDTKKESKETVKSKEINGVDQSENSQKIDQNFESTLKKAIDNLNEKLEQITNEKNTIESQLTVTLADLKTSQNENSILISKHEQQVVFLNEQLQLFQVNYINKA